MPSTRSLSSPPSGIDLALDLQDIQDMVQATERRLEVRCEQLRAAVSVPVASLLERITACELHVLCAWDKQSHEIESLRESQARVEQELKAMECRPAAVAARGCFAEQSSASTRSRDVQFLAGGSSRIGSAGLESCRTVEEALCSIDNQTYALQKGRESLAGILRASRGQGRTDSSPWCTTEDVDRGVWGSIAARQQAASEQLGPSAANSAILSDHLRHLEGTLWQNKSLFEGGLRHLQDIVVQHAQDLHGLQGVVKDLGTTADKHARAHQDQRCMMENLQDAVRDLCLTLEDGPRASRGT